MSYSEDLDRCSNGCVCTPEEQALAGTHPWVITDGDGKILAAYMDEDDRDGDLACDIWPDDAEPAYIN